MNEWNEGGGGDPHWAKSNLGGMYTLTICDITFTSQTLCLCLHSVPEKY